MKWLNRILVALVVAGALAWLPRQIASVRAGEDLARVQRERDALVEGNAELREEIAMLEAEVSALHGDPHDPERGAAVAREIERIAREDLNMVRSGEFVFEIKTAPAEGAEPGAQP